MSILHRVTVVVIGDTGVGKSCLLLQFVDKRFSPAHDLTVGVDFGSRVLTVGEEKIKLQIWDTAGQESFRSIVKSYYRAANGALLVFDVTRRETFLHVNRWLDETRAYANEHLIVTLVGNKADLKSKRAVSIEEAMALAEQLGLAYVETSAKTAEGVESAFLRTAAAIWVKHSNGFITLQEETNERGMRVSSTADGTRPSSQRLRKTDSMKCC